METKPSLKKPSVHVVIPAFKVASHIQAVLDGIGPEVERVWVVDDACPDRSGEVAEKGSKDPRLAVVRNPTNLGVGGATREGMQRALDEGADVIVKIDGDGQMDPSRIGELINPLLLDQADYSKGNRFFSPTSLRAMPPIRILGNAVLSFWSKISSGYWSVNDPTNGYVAISSFMAKSIDLEKLNNRYFFESDLLYRLRLSNARIRDIPMDAIYGEEKSNLRIWKVLVTFPLLHLRNTLARIFYQYYLREWSIASLELPLGLGLVVSGGFLGISSYASAVASNQGVTAGQISVSSLMIILGVQLLLSFVAYDIASEPRKGNS